MTYMCLPNAQIHKIGTDWKKLHEFIDPDCLPVEYGGTLKDTACPEVSWP